MEDFFRIIIYMSKKRQSVEQDPVSEKVVLSKRGWNDFFQEAGHVNEQRLRNEAALTVQKEISKKQLEEVENDLENERNEKMKLEEENKLLKKKNESYTGTKVDQKEMGVFDKKENQKMLELFTNEIRKQGLAQLDEWSKARKK